MLEILLGGEISKSQKFDVTVTLNIARKKWKF